MSSQLSNSIKLVTTVVAASSLTACITVNADVDPDYQRPANTADEKNEARIAERIDPKPPRSSKTESSVSSPTSLTKISSQDAAKPTERKTQGGGPLEDQPLILDTEGLIDEDGIGQLNFQWQVQEPTGRWIMADEGTAQAFTPRQKDVGKALRARIEYLDGQGTLETIVTPATGPVQNVNDLPVGRLSLMGNSQEDQTLQIDASALTDEDGLGLLTYNWERSADGINWAPYQTNNSDPSLLRLNQAQVGYAYRGRVNYVDGYGTNEALVSSSSGVVQNIDDPAVGSVIINGPLFKGSKLSVDTSNISDEDGIASITATWQISNDGLSWQAASDVKNRELSLNKTHVGKVVRARAVIVDNFGNQAEIYSSVSTPVENVNSKPAGVVRIMTAE